MLYINSMKLPTRLKQIHATNGKLFACTPEPSSLLTTTVEQLQKEQLRQKLQMLEIWKKIQKMLEILSSQPGSSDKEHVTRKVNCPQMPPDPLGVCRGYQGLCVSCGQAPSQHWHIHWSMYSKKVDLTLNICKIKILYLPAYSFQYHPLRMKIYKKSALLPICHKLFSVNKSMMKFTIAFNVPDLASAVWGLGC